MNWGGVQSESFAIIRMLQFDTVPLTYVLHCYRFWNIWDWERSLKKQLTSAVWRELRTWPSQRLLTWLKYKWTRKGQLRQQLQLCSQPAWPLPPSQLTIPLCTLSMTRKPNKFYSSACSTLHRLFELMNHHFRRHWVMRNDIYRLKYFTLINNNKYLHNVLIVYQLFKIKLLWCTKANIV